MEKDFEDLCLLEDEILCDHCEKKYKKKNIARHKMSCEYVQVYRARSRHIIELIEKFPDKLPEDEDVENDLKDVMEMEMVKRSTQLR